MGHFGHESPKPEKGWTNHPKFAELNKGKWKRKQSSGSGSASSKTVLKSISKTTGKPSFSGTKELKKTQPRPYLFKSLNYTWTMIVWLSVLFDLPPYLTLDPFNFPVCPGYTLLGLQMRFAACTRGFSQELKKFLPSTLKPVPMQCSKRWSGRLGQKPS